MNNRSAPPGTIVPRLLYQDVGKAIAWLCGAFGFSERLRTPPGPDGSIHHAQLLVGDGSVMLTARPAGSEPAGKGFVEALFVPVGDVDAHCRQARESGARIVSAPRTYPFGERQYTALDLEGNAWMFSQSVADVDPADWAAPGSTH